MNRTPPADTWSDTLRAQTRDVLGGRGAFVLRDGRLYLKHAGPAFGTIAGDDLARGVFRIVDRRTGAETTFASADEVIGAGWVID